MAHPMDGIAPDTETSLRAHVGEVEACWLDVHCGSCRGTTIIPLRLIVRKYGPDIEVGAYVARLTCKRCGIPPSAVRLKESPNDVVSKGAGPGWSVLLIDRPTVSASGRDHSQEQVRPG